MVRLENGGKKERGGTTLANVHFRFSQSQQIILVGHGTLKADTKKCTDKFSMIEMGQKHKNSMKLRIT